jgi:hypothetical protein
MTPSVQFKPTARRESTRMKKGAPKAPQVITWRFPGRTDLCPRPCGPMTDGQGRHSICSCQNGNPSSSRQVVRHLQRRFQMTDFRDQNDQFYGNSGYEPPNDNGNRWGWIAGAAFLVVVLGLAFSVGHQPTRVASNDNVNSPITTPAAPPSNPMTAPGLTPPPATPNRP